jgi:hypothetical protein
MNASLDRERLAKLLGMLGCGEAVTAGRPKISESRTESDRPKNHSGLVR